MKNFLLILLVGAFSILNAQNVCYHTVVSGDNLYRIGKAYKTNEAGLKELNPGLTAALDLGQKVKVPCVDGGKQQVTMPPFEVVSPAVVSNEQDEFKGNYIFHSIVQGETIYFLTRKYGISEAQFNKDNPDVATSGLKVGGVVKLFQKDTSSEDEIAIDGYFLKVAGTGKLNHFNADTNKLKDSTCVNIAVMLPFQFEKNVEYLKRFKDEQEPQLYKTTRTFVELYQGIKMAVDSAVRAGLNAQLFVFDTKRDTAEIRKIIAQPMVKQMDLVIGPGYTKTFEYAAKLLKETNIPLISPFSKKDVVINGFPNAIRVIPSDKSHYKAIGEYVAKHYYTENVIIAMENKDDDEAAKIIQREIIAKGMMLDSVKLNVPKITQGIYQPIDSVKKDKKNIIILANNKEGFSSKLTAKLIPSSSRNEIILFGLDDLKKYKNIEVDYWDSLNIHVSSAADVKYGYPLADQFISSYFKKYYSEPSSFAFTGYDFTLLLLRELLYDRNYSHNKLVGNYFIGGLRDYKFGYNGDQNGISNNSVYVYKYSNFKFIKLND